jgi:hypothetical protein
MLVALYRRPATPEGRGLTMATSGDDLVCSPLLGAARQRLASPRASEAGNRGRVPRPRSLWCDGLADGRRARAPKMHLRFGFARRRARRESAGAFSLTILSSSVRVEIHIRL